MLRGLIFIDTFTHASMSFQKIGCGDPVLLSRGAITSVKDSADMVKSVYKHIQL